MKHVPKLHSEPELLATYRADHPADTSAAGADAGRVWERFRDDPAYKDLRDRLIRRQQGLCGYCEQRLTTSTGEIILNDQQIEHVLSKSGGAGRTLDWTNLVLCCAGGTNPNHSDPSRRKSGQSSESCGQSKSDHELGRRCDPRDFPCDTQLVRVGTDGRLFADIDNCYAAGINPTTLDDTLDKILNLNCERLRLKRESVMANVQVHFWLAEQLLEQTTLTVKQRSEFVELIVAGRLQPDAHGHLCAFWTTERQGLAPWSDPWITRNQQLFT